MVLNGHGDDPPDDRVYTYMIENGFEPVLKKPFAGDLLGEPDEGVAGTVIYGGKYNVFDVAIHPFLDEEYRWIDACLDTFGPDHCIIGSNWPVDRLYSSYDPIMNIYRDHVSRFDEGDQPATVTLRFTGEQAIRRMHETVWHPSERKERDAEGRLIWTADIDEPQEMLPWIRGWAADCEVLEPQELREKAMGEVRRQMRMYGIGQSSEPGAPDLDLLGSLFGE